MALNFKRPAFAYAKVRKKTPLDFNCVYLGNIIQQAKTHESHSADEKKKKIFRQLGNILHS